MNALDFLRTRRGLILAAAGALLIVLALLPSCRSTQRPPGKPKSLPTLDATSSNSQISLLRPTLPIARTPLRTEQNVRTNARPIIFSVHVDLPPETNVAQAAAPYGRLLQCQLVNTLESLAPNTPILGLVTEDLWFNGRLIIPTGSEIHGQAHLDRTRERINSAGPWRVVFHDGRQLALSGVALDREFDVAGSGWGITDGSAGIRGDVLRSGSLEEIKLFLAAALSGLTAGLQQTRSTPFGSFIPGTLRNAGLSGASQVMAAYAQRVQEAIKTDGLYVRVPAGKEFYVYLTETIGEPGFESARATTGSPATSHSSP